MPHYNNIAASAGLHCTAYAIAAICVNLVSAAANEPEDEAPPRAAPARESDNLRPVGQRPEATRQDERRIDRQGSDTGRTAVLADRRLRGRSHSFRIVTFNTYLLSPNFQCGPNWNPEQVYLPADTFTNCTIFNPLGENIKERANLIADVLDDGEFDVIALNEVWDEDDGKDVLEERLKATYSNYVKYVDSDGVKDAEDSGLMIFSKPSFQFESLPDEHFKGGDTVSSEGDDSAKIAFDEYDDCSGFDCSAAKGAVMVRIKHPSSGRILNFIATHTQADGENAEDRKNQLLQVLGDCASSQTPPTEDLVHKTLGPSLAGDESLCNWSNQQWLVLLGDLNVNGINAVGDALFSSSTPASEAPEEWWDRFGNPAKNVSGYALYDAWAETTSEADLGVTFPSAQRLDYIVASRRTKSAGQSLLAGVQIPDLCIQHVWTPPALIGLSDHWPVAADLNLENPQCNPRLAYEITSHELGEDDLIDGKESVILPRQISFPGGVQWFFLPESGTYTFALDPNAVNSGLQFEVYKASNLSKPLTGAHELGEDKILVCPPGLPEGASRGRCKEHVGEKLVLPKGPFYVKVFSQNRGWTGDYWLAVHRYTCKSKEEACELLANAPYDFPFPPPGTYLNPEDRAWFSFSVQEQADTGEKQTLTFYTENAEDEPWSAPDIEILDSSGSTVLQEIDGSTFSSYFIGAADSGREIKKRTATTNHNDAYYMRVKRLNVNHQLHVLAGWRTNLTLLGGENVGEHQAYLVCQDETNPEAGADEIGLQVNVDGTGWQTRGTASFDCNATKHPRQWDGPLGLIRYLDSVQIRLMEYDSGNPDNASNVQFSPVWPTATHEVFPEFRHSLPFEWEGGLYNFDFNTSKWRN